jgi:predicted Holliday junction resolvase-like endonuclease
MNWIDIVTGLVLFGLAYLYYKSSEKNDILDKIINMVVAENEALSKKIENINLYYEDINQNFDQQSLAYKEKISSLQEDLKLLYKEQNSLITELSDHKQKYSIDIKKAREEALTKSRSVMRGQATEHLAPYIIKGTNPKDYRFMGNPVDYVIFEGLSDVLDGQADNIKSITFLDIKTGKSNLNKSQRRIRDAIASNSVKFQLINIDEAVTNGSDLPQEERTDQDLKD